MRRQALFIILLCGISSPTVCMQQEHTSHLNDTEKIITGEQKPPGSPVTHDYACNIAHLKNTLKKIDEEMHQATCHATPINTYMPSAWKSFYDKQHKALNDILDQQKQTIQGKPPKNVSESVQDQLEEAEENIIDNRMLAKLMHGSLHQFKNDDYIYPGEANAALHPDDCYFANFGAYATQNLNPQRLRDFPKHFLKKIAITRLLQMHQSYKSLKEHYDSSDANTQKQIDTCKNLLYSLHNKDNNSNSGLKQTLQEYDAMLDKFLSKPDKEGNAFEGLRQEHMKAVQLVRINQTESNSIPYDILGNNHHKLESIVGYKQ